eukprot:scaffold1726_cov260-Pinguiococcus_pyrenoidosus.AAC.24
MQPLRACCRAWTVPVLGKRVNLRDLHKQQVEVLIKALDVAGEGPSNAICPSQHHSHSRAY